MSIASKSNYIIETKNQIKEAIKEKGVEVSDTDTFRSYADKIREIQSGEEIEGQIDELLKLRAMNGKLYLSYFLDHFVQVYAGVIGDATQVCQLVQNGVINWCKNNTLENIAKMDYAFSYWNYGLAQYINYDLDISHWSFDDKITFANCFFSSFFRKIKLPNIIKPSNISSTFQNCSNLIKIEGIIDCSNVNTSVSATFSSCAKLEEVYLKNLNNTGLKLDSCTNLKKECILYLFENAMQQTTTKTLTLGSTNLAKLTSEEIAIITNKGWTVS